jgi:uncharacterized protein (TIRG00374 family)
LTIAIVGSLRLREVSSVGGRKIPFYQAFKTYLGGYSIMYLFPIAIFSGELFRVYGLKKAGLAWEGAVSSVLIERILELTFNTLLILFGLSIFSLKFDFLPDYSVYGFIFLIFLLLFFFYFNAMKKNSIVGYAVNKLKRGTNNNLMEIEKNVFNYFNYKNKSLYKSMFFSLLKIFFMQLRLIIIIIFLTGTIIPYMYTFPMLGFASLSAMIPVPAGLGTYEFSQIFVFKNIGLNYSTAISSSLIVRVVEVIVCFLGIFYIIKTGFNFIGNKLNIFDISEK